MLRVGLTGGIGCGKSTVAAMMRELGCHILDADELAHRLIEPGEAAYDDVVREFGREILAPDGRIERPNLAAIVFADPARRAKLECLHPSALLAERARGASPPRTGRSARRCRHRSGPAGRSRILQAARSPDRGLVPARTAVGPPHRSGLWPRHDHASKPSAAWPRNSTSPKSAS